MPSAIYNNTSLSSLPELPNPSPHVRAFHRSLPHYESTPLVSLPEMAKKLGIGHLLLKDETSRLGLPAFKILGASWATARAVSGRLATETTDDPILSLEGLSKAAKESGFVLFAATEGNHGRAVARMAKYLGIGARIYVPKESDDAVKNNLRSEGAEVVVWEGSYDDAVVATKAAAEQYPLGKGLLISDTALVPGEEVSQWIVDGYQTMLDEIEEQIGDFTNADITHVLTPVGVGSLCQAVVTHFRRPSRSKKPDIVTVEPDGAACLKSSLEAGKMVSVDVGYTICSGMCCGTVSASAWPLLKRGVSMAVTVDDVTVEKTMMELQHSGVNAGPCGAATTAALEQLTCLNENSVVLVLCTELARVYEMDPKEPASRETTAM